MVVPNNNDTLAAPFTEQLAKDYDVFNQVLTDYGMDLSNCIYILNSMKSKNSKEKVIKAKREQQRLEEERLMLIKEKEDSEKRELLEKELKEQQKSQNFGSINSTDDQMLNINGNDNMNDANNDDIGNNDDVMMDLDLDNFNFDGDGAEVLNFDFDDPMSLDSGNLQNINQKPVNQSLSPIRATNDITASLSNTDSAPANLTTNPTISGTTVTATATTTNTSADTGANTNANSNDYLNFGQDNDLVDLNLDFLQDDEMGSLMQNMGDTAVSNNSKNDNDNDEAMAADQMEQLFSQFDEMVGNGI